MEKPIEDNNQELKNSLKTEIAKISATMRKQLRTMSKNEIIRQAITQFLISAEARHQVNILEKEVETLKKQLTKNEDKNA